MIGLVYLNLCNARVNFLQYCYNKIEIPCTILADNNPEIVSAYIESIGNVALDFLE